MNGGSKMVGAVRNWVSDRRHRAAVEEVRAVLDEIARRQREEAARSTAEDEAAARKKEGKGPGEEGPRP
jgi:CHASE3 domain sensor protein